MIAVDTNILVYAHREDSEWFSSASECVRHLAEGVELWAAPSLVHDARVAAVCMHHGVEELWTADRDFGRFPALKVRNPLVT